MDFSSQNLLPTNKRQLLRFIKVKVFKLMENLHVTLTSGFVLQVQLKNVI